MRRALLALLLVLPFAAQAAAPTALKAEDVPALLKPPAHGVRVLALWALDCAYCEPNLQALATLQHAHPREIELIAIATDSIDQRDAIARRLREAGVDTLPSRAYADETPERINYLFDPDWGGELPRTLVIRAGGQRSAFSGALTPSALRAIAPP
jgi:iron complex outermembrane receptor protein